MFSSEFDIYRGQRCYFVVLIAFLVVSCGGGESDDAAFDDGRNWGESVVVANGSSAGIVESLYVAEDDVYVSWKAWGLYSVWLAHYTDALGWEDGLDLGGNYGSRVAGGGGNVFISWQAPDSSSRFALDDVAVARHTVGAGLELPLVLNVLDTRVSSVDLSVGASGDALVVWVQDDDFRVGNLWASYYSSDSGWGSAQLLGGVDVNLGWQSGVSVDRHGNAMVVWGDSSSGKWSSYYSSVTGWGVARPIAIAAGHSTLAMNDAGDSMVIWSDADGCWASQYDIATGWQSAVSVNSHSDGGECYAADMDGQGNVIVAWGGDQGVWVRHYSVTNGWQPVVLVVSTPDSGAVSLDVAESGDAVLGWRERTADTQFWSSYYVSGSGWGRAKLVSTTGGVDDTFISMRKGGGAVAAWRQGSDAETRVMSNFYK